MTKEEKAKAYDEALETARRINSGEGVAAPLDWTICEVIFPELKENENEDERIRKELILHLEELRDWKVNTMSPIKVSYHYDRWIAWLEKQKDSVSNTKYIEDVAHAFEDGRKKGIEEKQKEQKPVEFFDEYKIIKKHITEDMLSSEVNKRLTECGWYVTDEKPVEWTELTWKDVNDLEEIMNEVRSDYRGGGIGQKSFGLEVLERFRYMKGDELDVKEQKPEWSEEDEDALNMCLDAIPKKWKTKSGTLLTKWLKDNIHLKKEWSEEDERMLSRCIKSVECSKQFADSETYKAAKDVEMNWLKSLHGRFNLQPKQEWSEEDKFRLEDAITGIDVGIGFYETEGKHPNLLKAIIEAKEWLKSLPERFNLQPKNEWSNEDLQHKSWILECLADGERKMPEYAEDFRAAYKWLKSLRPQPKQEWSEEDKHRCKDAIYFLETAKKHYASTSEIELTIEWLKSLQPQARQEQTTFL